VPKRGEFPLNVRDAESESLLSRACLLDSGSSSEESESYTDEAREPRNGEVPEASGGDGTNEIGIVRDDDPVKPGPVVSTDGVGGVINKAGEVRVCLKAGLPVPLPLEFEKDILRCPGPDLRV
jgi:hypothetical protein